MSVKVEISDSYEAMSLRTAKLIASIIKDKPDALLCFPSGDSPTKAIEYLIEFHRCGEVDFSKARFIGLDEWVGMDKDDEGSCQHYIYRKLFDPLEIKEENIIFFNAKADNLSKECERIDRYVAENGPIDMMLVGLGMNGHIGLNEPGVHFNLYSHYIQLDSVTKTVAQKYFSKHTNLEKGITLGLQHLLDAKVAILIASGTKKAEIVAKVIEGEVSEEVPATVMHKHKNGYIFLDRDAATKLKDSLYGK